jgi:hypothetical protein
MQGKIAAWRRIIEGESGGMIALILSYQLANTFLLSR